MEERKFLRLFLLLPSILVLYFVYQIFQPFLMAIFLATILATLCYPVYRMILVRVKDHPSLAALLTCLGITAVIIVPFVLLLISLANEVRQVLPLVQDLSRREELQQLADVRHQPYIGPVLDYLSQYVEIDSKEIINGLASWAERASGFFISSITRLVQSIVTLLANFTIMIVTMFFLFRDGSRLMDQFQAWTPLSERYEGLIVDTFQGVASATVLGSLLTAVAQGVAGGLVFWILGLPNAVLWGSLMALFSLVPVVGTGIVWVPWTLYLLAVGSWVKAIVLVAAAVLFVGMIDNVLRPLLIEGKAKMHTLLVFFSIMGGISHFGIIGMIIGPIIVALGLTFLKLYRIEYETELSRKKFGEEVAAVLQQEEAPSRPDETPKPASTTRDGESPA